MTKSSISRVLKNWSSDPLISSCITQVQTKPPQAAQFTDLPAELHPHLREKLESLGIHRLYTHQADSWQIAQAGKNMVVVTGTASGKSLCYQLPILQSFLQTNYSTSALCIFPTKALTQDQLNNVSKLFPSTELPNSKSVAAIYDGDTSQDQRRKARSEASIILTNPDMLHLGILPYHTQWASFFRNLKWIVIDEIHMYKGVFGSNIANVIRRLKRILAFYGSQPQFILTSATIANPQELAEKLIEEPVECIHHDGSPKGVKHFILYNPPIIDERLGIRASARTESLRLAGDLIAYDAQTLLFSHTRPAVEKVLKELRLQFPALADQIFGYRSGYLPQERRRIEKSLKERKAKLVTATNALELGIDIGSVDAVVIAGFPGSIASTLQQTGRAGRREEESLSVLIASSNPLDQYIIRHPEYVLGNAPEKAIINPDNLLILLKHIQCSLFELPFSHNDHYGALSPETLQELLDFLCQASLAHQSNEKTYWVSDQYPAAQISLRSATAETIQLRAQTINGPKTIGVIDQSSAYWMVHPGAVYLHSGESYLVENLDLDHASASLIPMELDYFTESKSQTDVDLLRVTAQEQIAGGTKSTGEVIVTSQVTGYRKVSASSHEQIGVYPLDLPATQLRTIGLWFTLSSETIQRLEDAGLIIASQNYYGPHWNAIREQVRLRDHYTCQVCGAKETISKHHVHHKIPFRRFTDAQAANQLDNLITLCTACHRRAEVNVMVKSGMSGLKYALHHLAPLEVLCDSNDLGVLYDPNCQFADGLPTIIFYDQFPDGVGLSAQLYDQFYPLLLAAQEVITNCSCTEGCPACVGPLLTDGESSKAETLEILHKLL